MATEECRCIMFFSICQKCDNIGNKYLQERDTAFMKINQINVKNKICNCNMFYTCKQCYKEELTWIQKYHRQYLDKENQKHQKRQKQQIKQLNEMTEFSEWKSNNKLLKEKHIEEPYNY
jgi:hypothetical protein